MTVLTEPFALQEHKLDRCGVAGFVEHKPAGSQLGLQVPVSKLDQKAWEIVHLRIGHPNRRGRALLPVSIQISQLTPAR